jgi:hypothetical protein
MKINKALLLESIQTIKTTGKYADNLDNWVNTIEKRSYNKPYTYLNEIATHLSSLDDLVDVLSIFPKWTDSNNAYWGTSIALTTYLLLELPLELPNKEVHIKGNHIIDQPTLIEGDLIIDGDLNINYMEGNSIGLVVLGNLTIKGNYPLEDGLMIVFGNVTIEGALDEDLGWSLTVIGGHLNVHKYISSSGELFVGKKATSPFMYLYYNQGFSVLKEGFSALYFHESDHGSSLCLGSYEASFILIDEIRGVETLEVYDNYKNLQKIISKEALGSLAEADLDNYDKEQYEDLEEYLEEELEFDRFDLADDLLSAFQEGKTVFNSTALKEWKNNVT